MPRRSLTIPTVPMLSALVWGCVDSPSSAAEVEPLPARPANDPVAPAAPAATAPEPNNSTTTSPSIAERPTTAILRADQAQFAADPDSLAQVVDAGSVTTRADAGANSLAGQDADTAMDAGAGTCPFAGDVQYQLNNPDTWPADARSAITTAMDEALLYYNCYADLQKRITVNYNPGVPTAEANVDGWLSFGSNRAYMVVATAMHEVAHTLGVGYFPWTELTDNGRWTGSAVDEVISTLPPEQRDPDTFSQRDFITADAQHFWPYGLNQAAEHQSEWSLINHVRLVEAMQRDKDSFLGQ